MDTMPLIKYFADGSKYWETAFDSFSAKIYLPNCDLPTDIINYCFMTPYLLIFEENNHSMSFSAKKSFTILRSDFLEFPVSVSNDIYLKRFNKNVQKPVAFFSVFIYYVES